MTNWRNFIGRESHVIAVQPPLNIICPFQRIIQHNTEDIMAIKNVNWYFVDS